MRETRRAFLATVGAAGFAGCTGIVGSGDPDGTANPGNASKSGNVSKSGNASGTDNTSKSGNTTEGDSGTETSGDSSHEIDVGTQFEGFEDPQYWYSLADQGTIKPVSDDAYTGSQSLRLHASPDDVFVGAFKSFSEPQDLSGKSLSLAVKLNKPRVAKLWVALLAPDEGNMVKMTRTLPGPYGTWVRSDMGVTTVRGKPDLSSVQEIRLVGRRRGQENTPIDIVVDDLRLADASDTGYVTLTFDDSHVSHYEKAFPIMQEYGFPGVEGVIAKSIYNSNRLDVGMMRKMSEAGWDMASHPFVGSKFLPEFSPSKQEKLIKRNKQFLVKKGFRDGARHFLTPRTIVGSETMNIVTDLHETLYTFGGMPNGLPATTNYYKGRINAANTAPVKQLIDYTAEYGDHLVLNHHIIGPGENELSERDFRAVLDYIKQSGATVATCSEMLAKKSKG